jgi:hypothetical protein
LVQVAQQSQLLRKRLEIKAEIHPLALLLLLEVEGVLQQERPAREVLVVLVAAVQEMGLQMEVLVIHPLQHQAKEIMVVLEQVVHPILLVEVAVQAQPGKQDKLHLRLVERVETELHHLFLDHQSPMLEVVEAELDQDLIRVDLEDPVVAVKLEQD